MMIRLLAITLIVLAAAPALADCNCYELEDPVAGHPGKTWYDLAKAIAPDLTPEGRGTQTIELRYLEDLGDADEDPVIEGPFAIYNVESRMMEAEGRKLTVLSLNLGPADGWAINIEALALFDENLKLLDAVNVGQDMSTGLWGDPIRIAPTDEALLTYSEHFNSNQAYGSYALMMVKDGKWQTIDTISTLSDHWCAHDRTQTLDVSAPDAGAGYRPLTVTVTDTQTFDETMDCGDQAAEPDFTRTYATTYSWSASMGAYVAGEDGIAALGEINRERY
jgi:hypothetical protein